jgi:hypothetical protein
VDPKDKFAMLLYFGNFTGRSFLIAPSKINLPVQRFDTIFVKSSAALHKAEEFEGFWINISAYSKTTTPETKKGLLQIKSGCEWAITA